VDFPYPALDWWMAAWPLCVGMAFAISQPTRPTQPAIPPGSVKWVKPIIWVTEGGDLCTAD